MEGLGTGGGARERKMRQVIDRLMPIFEAQTGRIRRAHFAQSTPATSLSDLN